MRAASATRRSSRPWSCRRAHIPDRFLPDKAIDLIDEAASRARIDNFRRRRRREASVLSGAPEEYWREIRAVQASQEAVSGPGFQEGLYQHSLNQNQSKPKSSRAPTILSKGLSIHRPVLHSDRSW